MNRAIAAVTALLACGAGHAFGADRFALVVTGASGSPEHAATHAKRSAAIVSALSGPLALNPRNVVVLKDGPSASPETATRENLRKAMTDLAARVTPEDVLLIVLLGHGTDDGSQAKYNVVGPDVTTDDWRDMLKPLRGRLVFINTTSASAAFLSRLAGPQRVVITATDTPAQQYDTVFAEYLGPALNSNDADLDKDGRVSIGEAFTQVSAQVKQYYSERGQLATERSVLDDDGDGRGKQAGTAGPDGSLASRTFFDPGPELAATKDTALSELLARRNALETTLDELKRKKEFMPEADYNREMERVLL
ncbi:MAG: hypothetical protein AB7I50_01655, partial [Vicinamibacterales bacterium]